ncbi:MAG: hypothetical protein ABIJ03_02000, partial [Patescibacteria group bacterium]
IMDRFYSIFVDSDDDSSQCWLRKNQQRKCIKDAISSHCPYFATSLLNDEKKHYWVYQKTMQK